MNAYVYVWSVVSYHQASNIKWNNESYFFKGEKLFTSFSIKLLHCKITKWNNLFKSFLDRERREKNELN